MYLSTPYLLPGTNPFPPFALVLIPVSQKCPFCKRTQKHSNRNPSCQTVWCKFVFGPASSTSSSHLVVVQKHSSSSSFFLLIPLIWCLLGFPDSSVGKESTCNGGDPGSIPRSGRSFGEGIGYPLQCSWSSLVAELVKTLPTMWETWVQSMGWEDLRRREMLPTPVCWPGEFHGVTKSQTRLSVVHFHDVY